jgi:hypothetical protein
VLAGVALFAGTEVMEALHEKQPVFDLYEELSHWLETASAIIAGAGIVLWWLRRHGRAVLIAFCLACFVAAELMVAGVGQIAPLQSAYGVAQVIKPHLRHDTPVFLVKTYNQSLPFYLRQPVTLVAYEGELYFGLQQEPDRWIPDIAEFSVTWRRLDQAVAVMRCKTFNELEDVRLPMRLIESRNELCVVLRRPD